MPARATPAERLLDTALASSELRAALEGTSRAILAGIRDDDTEAAVAGVFERVLYPTLEDAGLSFHPRSEMADATARHVGAGRADSRTGRLVIEFTRPRRLLTGTGVAAARAQLEGHLRAVTERGGTAVGLATDGRAVIEIRAVGGCITARGGRVSMSAEALRRIARHVHALRLTALTGDNLIRDLCAPGGGLVEVARRLRGVLDARGTGRTAMLERQWRAMYRLGHTGQQARAEQRRAALGAVCGRGPRTPDEEYACLFALHTAYAIALKLMAARVLSEIICDRQLTRWGDRLRGEACALRAFCESLESGRLPRSLGFLNLLEGDVFSWYCDAEQWDDEIGRAVGLLVEVLAGYEATPDRFAEEAAVDLFRRLYEAAVPPVVRASFGEFHTPAWLAEDVLDAARFTAADRLLDPCSGSGTVLVAAIEAVRRAHPGLPAARLLDIITRSVAGIDLNPLCVLTSRVNYFVRIADLVPEDVKDLVIPVYLGDASSVPSRVAVGDVACIAYASATSTEPIAVSLPVSLASDARRFVAAMHRFEDAVRDGDVAGAVAAVAGQLAERERTPAILDGLGRLARRLAGRDGFWARVVTNFVAAASLEPFTVVAGNPPWIDWKSLPAGYREEVKGLAVARHLFSGDGRTGGINLNVCALITHVAMSSWLTESGRLAFLMPRELAFQQSYQGWRRLEGRPGAAFVEFRDWSRAGHPFDPVKEDFMTFVIGPGDPRAAVPVRTYSKVRGERSRAHEWATRATALAKLECTSATAGQIIPGSTAFTFAGSTEDLDLFALVAGHCPYKGREGVEFYPQELQLFRYVRPGPGPGLVWVQNVQSRRSRYRVAQEEVLLETVFLHPLVKGPYIDRFRHRYDGLLAAFPYDAADPHRPIVRHELRGRSPRLLAHYERHADLIGAQTQFSDTIRGPDPGEFYGLARTGPYSFADVYLAFRDNTSWRACVVDSAELPWGERKRFVFQNHAVSMCERPGGGPISGDEAHYLCAILNAPVVERFILASSDSRSFKIRPPVHVPTFDPADRGHRELAAYSVRAHDDPEAADELRREMERVYLDLCARAAARDRDVA